MRGVAAALLVIAASAVTPAQEIAGPKIAVREMTHDFGKVPQGSEVVHVFEVTNKGTETLIIERVVPS